MTKGMVCGLCGMGYVGCLVGVDRIVDEDVLYAHEVWNRGIKGLFPGGICPVECVGVVHRSCVGMLRGVKWCEGRAGGGVYGMDRNRVWGGSA